MKKLISELYLEYEYDPPQHYPINFESSLDFFSQGSSQQNDFQSSTDLSTHYQSRNLVKIGSKDITRHSDGSYRFHSWNQPFSSLFDLVHALSRDYSFETIFSAFSWQEFEDFITSACHHYGYHAFRTFRYTIDKKRHEVDVIARENHRIFFIDAKRWTSQTVSLSALGLAAEHQVTRAEHLVQDSRVAARLLHQLHVPSHQLNTTTSPFYLYPIILVSSNIPPNTIIHGVSIVAFSQFNAFLNVFPKIAPDLRPILLNTPSLKEENGDTEDRNQNEKE
ncbi:MAG: restriction endonuclease [Promethearchaeota archaeon]